ncbi:uncharacterized protein LOC119093845 [Pollicipes pollicipes]|uniref:uncharacterized protein LOC119093845 n=1 Tax=Pollicipes pollicipes TaxID=41117 RepID=UPI001884DADD|nr:uncharacterized protein LOC119093845 [Pollicipes pollicipes]
MTPRLLAVLALVQVVLPEPAWLATGPLTLAQLAAGQLSSTDLTESQLTESQLMESQLASSLESESQASVNQLTLEQLAEGQLSSADLTENQLTESHLTESQLTESQLTENQLTESQLMGSLESETQASAGQLTGDGRLGDGPAPAAEPFRVFWNVPSAPCTQSFGVDLNPGQYGFTVNAGEKFAGEQIALLYSPGLFPNILKNGSEVNGGLPQVGSLDVHLKRFQEDLERSVPDVNFSGSGGL